MICHQCKSDPCKWWCGPLLWLKMAVFMVVLFAIAYLMIGAPGIRLD